MALIIFEDWRLTRKQQSLSQIFKTGLWHKNVWNQGQFLSLSQSSAMNTNQMVLDSNNVCPERFLKGSRRGRVSPDNLQRPPFREVLGKKGHALVCRRPKSRETSCAFSTKAPVLSQLTQSSCPGSGLMGESFIDEQTKIFLLTLNLFWLRRLSLIDTLSSV